MFVGFCQNTNQTSKDYTDYDTWKAQFGTMYLVRTQNFLRVCVSGS